MRFIDPHVHMTSRTTDDYQAMAAAGVVAIIEPAFWLGQPRTTVGAFHDYFASLVGFGGVIAALPAFAAVREWVLVIEGGPLVSLAVATNALAALTGSASGGLTIALDALGDEPG